MITRERFWDIIQTYNVQIWPFQLIMYIAALLLLIWLFAKPSRIQSLLMKLYFAISFAFTGIAFYMFLAKGMAGSSYGNYFLGALFVVVSVLFIIDVFRQGVFLHAAAIGSRKYLIPILSLCTICYPLIGIMLGHDCRESIVPGTFPCPTTALCLLVMATALPKVRKIMNVILLFCAIPFTIFFQVMQYGVYEDIVLFVTGIYSLILLVRHWKPRQHHERYRSIW